MSARKPKRATRRPARIEQLGDGPIEPRYVQLVAELASAIDQICNPDRANKGTGFVLMLFPLNDHGGRCSYVSNGRREDVVVLLREQLARFEGRMMPDAKA